MDTNKSIMVLFLVCLAYIPGAFSQEERMSREIIADSPAKNLVLAVKLSNDSIYIRSLLEQKSDYNQKGEWGPNALETAYYWGNQSAFNCVLDYILEQKDTSFIQKSMVLSTAIANGDTMTMSRLFSLYVNKLKKDEITDLFGPFSTFISLYETRNRYRSLYGDEEYSLYNTKNYDLEVAKVMMKYGIDFNFPDINGHNFMFYCRRYITVAKFLIENKPPIDLNLNDKSGNTFLKYFIDDILMPVPISYEDMEEYEKQFNDYGNSLDVLNYYISQGATLGSKKQKAWEYLMQELKSAKNPYLEDLINARYSEYIK